MKKLDLKDFNITEMDGYDEAIASANWAYRRFGGVWQGLIYALLVAGGYGGYVTGGEYGILPWLLSGLMFYGLNQYDITLVALWNSTERERVITQFVTDNLSTIIEDMEVIDSNENLDGTFEDE